MSNCLRVERDQKLSFVELYYIFLHLEQSTSSTYCSDVMVRLMAGEALTPLE